MSITHISGVALNVCGRWVQRCSLCGAKLCDSLNVSMPLNADGSEPEYATWPVARLIRVETGNPTAYRLLDDTDRLPDDSCIEFA